MTDFDRYGFNSKDCIVTYVFLIRNRIAGMKNSFLFCFAIILLLFSGCNNREKIIKPGRTLNRRLGTLLYQKEYFRLANLLQRDRDSLNDNEKLYYQAFIDNAFNRNEQAVRDVDSLMKGNFPRLPDSAAVALQLLREDSYFKLYRYAGAARQDSMILRNYSNVLDSEKLSDVKNHLLIRNALRSVPPQETIKKDSLTISWKKDRIGLIEIPLKCGNIIYDAIFDTRANISSISKTYAKKLGLRILDVSYEEGSGITGIKFKTGLGVADSLYIGNILIRNAVFQIMPDSILYLAPINFRLNIIIGFPVIEQLKEFHLYKNGRMFIPLTPEKAELHNFALDGLDPVISLKTGNDTLCFHLDLGADETILYSTYFERFKQKVLSEGKKKVQQYGGAGGIQKKVVYIIPSLALELGGEKITLDSVDVFTEKIFPGERFYGNLGRDFAWRFDELVFNFESMYIRGK